jgi:hypothetical protein
MKLKVLIAAATLLGTQAAPAHEGKSMHGGRTVEASERHVELVAKDGTIDVYVRDQDDKPLALAGYKGVAIVAIDGKSQRIPLEPVEMRLSGKATGTLPKRLKGVVQITPPNGRAINAKFD